VHPKPDRYRPPQKASLEHHHVEQPRIPEDTEGFDTLDLKQAKASLDELA
jgi:hypothetical protein